MEFDYQIVLFKNKLKKKIINQFKTKKRAEDFYSKLLLESSNVRFPKKFENGKPCDYEIALLERHPASKMGLYLKDKLGRQIKVTLEDDEFTITKIEFYNQEEEFLDYETKNKLTLPVMIKKYLNGDGVKLISKLNNKIVIQNDDKINLFTLKNDYESDRLIDTLSEIFLNENRVDSILVKDYSITQRKYLYNLLTERGFPKTYLQRHSTTHPLRK